MPRLDAESGATKPQPETPPAIKQFFDRWCDQPAITKTLRTGIKAHIRPLGNGGVVVIEEPLLDAKQRESATSRHRAYATLCELVGARYTPPNGVPKSAYGFVHWR